jgi:hypothetical protein
MSYYIYIGDADLNYTYNLSRFFHDHIDGPDASTGLQAIDGLTGREAALVVSAAFERAQETYLRGSEPFDKNMSIKYDPPNQWGSTMGALLFMGRVIAACLRNPRARVRVH